jgi:threonine aldolase
VLNFASDNYSPAHPEVLAAVTAANEGDAPAYGGDAWTGWFEARAAEIFGEGTKAFPVLSGTGANVLALAAVTPRWGSVICADVAHLTADEAAAPEHAGLKLLTCPTGADGKLTPDSLTRWTDNLGDHHRAQAATLSITQATEVGTVYTPAEIQALTDTAHAHGLTVHMDGSRLAGAAASLGLGLRGLTSDVGVDLLSLGAAKNGGMLGEAVIVLPDAPPAAREAVYHLRKRTLQLASKLRFVSAQLCAMYDGDLWHRNAQQANSMAARLAAAIANIPDITLTRPVQSNAVFASLPRPLAAALSQQAHFYPWGPGDSQDRVEVRWMTAWNTTTEHVERFAAIVRDTSAK